MYIGYIDDSGSSGTNLDDKQVPFQVIGGPVLDDKTYFNIQLALEQEIENLVPEEQWDDFEFHASDLFHGNPPFNKLGPGKCSLLIEKALQWINQSQAQIIYGATDKQKLKRQLYQTADPADMAFQLYLDGLEKWFGAKILSGEDTKGLLICDDVRIHKADDSRKEDIDRKGDIRSIIERAFRRNKNNPPHSRISLYLFDDIYFGNSKNSRGLQLADLCVYFIARHHAGKPDSEGFYNIIKDQIAFSEICP